MSFLSKIFKSVSNLGHKIVGAKTSDERKAANRAAEEAARKAAAEAQKAAHDAEVARLAQEAIGPITLRRKRTGLLSTRLTGTTIGGYVPTSEKTLLSQ